MPEVSPFIRLFVSSTFADFAVEREILQRAVFPQLRALCEAQGCRFQPIDLRWGVSEEAGNEKRTLTICLDEIAHCQRLSPDLNFLILLGDRYGTCFLPESLPSDQVARLDPYLTSAERAAFVRAYAEDHNALRAEYVLLPSSRTGDVRQAEESLRAALAHAAKVAGFSEQELLPFVASATHLEIQRGLLDAGCDPSATVCALRSFTAMPEGLQAAQYKEQDEARRAQLGQLKVAVERRLNGRIWRYSVPGEIPMPDMGQATHAYDNALAEQFYELLEPHIEDALARRQSTFQTRDPAAEANRQFAEARASVVVGRDDALDKVAKYIIGQTRLPLVVTGTSGVGKSTLLARAVDDAGRAHPNAAIVTRYIGVTPGTSSLADLLAGLRREIAERYGQPEPEPLGEVSQLVAAVAGLLGTLETSAEHPLFVIIDALDQLSARQQRVDWLPPKLAQHVRVVVSMTLDREELATMRARLPIEQMLQLDPLTRAQGAEVLHAWLTKEGRMLTAEQTTAVLSGFAPEANSEGTPLYLRLAFEQARTWRSFDAVPALPPEVPALVQAYFAELQQPTRHGQELVAYALGDLAAAKHGLAEDELLDLLSRSAAVREGLQRLSPNSPPIDARRPLPVVLWARLVADLEHYLTEREADGARLVTFYHRQVREEVERLYLDGTERTARHADLAAYFDEQLYWQGEGDARVWNGRKLAELVYQQVEADPASREVLQTTLTDMRFLEGKLTVEGVAATLDDLTFAPSDADIATIASAVRAGAVVLTKEPSELPNQITGRVGYVARLHSLPKRAAPWLRLRSQSLAPLDPAQLHILQGHTHVVTSCALSSDGRIALSASDDGTLRVWDTASGQTLQTLESHTVEVSGCALSADGCIALSFSHYDDTLRLWDTTSGQTLQLLKSQTGMVSGCALSADGHLALSTSAHMLGLWDTSSGRFLRALEDQSNIASECALSADGRIALTTSHDDTLCLWDTTSGQMLRLLKGHTDTVSGCALSADGHLALSGSADETLRLWDTASGQMLHVFRGHRDGVLGCALSADGRLALSASRDSTVRLWDTATGWPLRVFRGHRDGVSGCALSADGCLALSASSDYTLRLWDTTVNQSSHAPEPLVNSCALSTDGQLVLAASSYNSLLLLDAINGRSVRAFEGHTSAVLDCALSADGGGSLSLLPMTTHFACGIQPLASRCKSSKGTQTPFSTARSALTGDSLSLLPATVRSDCGILPTAQCLRVLKGQKGWVESCALNPDGHLALSGSADETLRLWDTASGHEIARWTHDTSFVSCALSADGRLIVATDIAGDIHFLVMLDLSGSDESPVVVNSPLVWPTEQVIAGAVKDWSEAKPEERVIGDLEQPDQNPMEKASRKPGLLQRLFGRQ